MGCSLPHFLLLMLFGQSHAKQSALQADNEFVEMLGQIRDGSAPASLVSELRSRCSDPVESEGIVATKV